jgi:hypothetical protein
VIVLVGPRSVGCSTFAVPPDPSYVFFFFRKGRG